MWRRIRLLSTGAERTGYSGAFARASPQGDRRHPLRFAYRLPMESTADMLRLWFYCPPPLPAVGALWDHRRHCEDMIDWYERRRGVDWEWQAADTKLLATPLGAKRRGLSPPTLANRGPSATCW